tara:strand:+ start:750 stop:1562 length:813 start_codon:yes stop_codon:yes gene_type:complete
MKILLITGNHPRHFYFIKKFQETSFNLSLIIEKRKDKFMPKINKNYKLNIKRLYKLHFNKRSIAEKKFFGDAKFNNKKVNFLSYVVRNDFSNGKLQKLISKHKFDILITYGCGLINNDILKMIRLYAWNVHGGLSPWYRGGATLFWPSYMLQPEYTGMTFHETTNKVDAGNIVFQNSAKIRPGDGIHDNACRVIKDFCDKLPLLLEKKILSKTKIKSMPQKSSGKIWTKKNWSPLNLKIIYELFDDKINKFCLKNRKIVNPKVINFLKIK